MIDDFCLFFLQIAAFITLPFDVVKTHRQIEMGEKEIYSGNLNTVVRITNFLS